jgi:hypothetical protein
MNELEVESCQLLLNALRRGTKFSSLSAYNKNIYEYLCEVRDLSQDGTKAELYERLLESVRQLWALLLCSDFTPGN